VTHKHKTFFVFHIRAQKLLTRPHTSK